MKLELDHMQRINLATVIGQQRGNLDELRMLWRLQDLIELTGEEKRAIGFHPIEQDGRVIGNGWDTGKSLPVKEYELSTQEIERITKAVNEWPGGFTAGFDRMWLEPLLGQLQNGQSENGKPK